MSAGLVAVEVFTALSPVAFVAVAIWGPQTGVVPLRYRMDGKAFPFVLPSTIRPVS